MPHELCRADQYLRPGWHRGCARRRLATAQDIKKFGTENQIPRDGYWVGFTDGSFVYTMVLMGPPGSVSVEQAQEIAGAYSDRLAGT
jgi:hypothetical protein